MVKKSKYLSLSTSAQTPPSSAVKCENRPGGRPPRSADAGEAGEKKYSACYGDAVQRQQKKPCADFLSGPAQGSIYVGITGDRRSAVPPREVFQAVRR